MTASEFLYTVVLKPKPLRSATNYAIKCILPKQVRYAGARVVLNPNDPVVSGALTFRIYEKSETSFLRRTFFSGMVFLDIGANVGYYTALGSLAAGIQGKVIAIEPDPDNFKYLTKTIESNRAQNTTCFELAVSDRVGRSQLYVSLDNRGDNRLYWNELASHAIEVQTTTVDRLLEDMGVAHVDVIKMDVQGAEGWVLRGMAKTLAGSKPLTLLTEFWPDGLRRANTDPKQLLEFLEESGLEIHELRKNGSIAPITDQDALIQRYSGRKYTNIVGLRR